MDKQDPIELIRSIQAFSDMHAPDEKQEEKPDLSTVPPEFWECFDGKGVN